MDAFQRGNFWQSVGGTDYHTLVNAMLLDPITINISANDGLAIPASLFGSCGALGIVNINTLDSIIVSKLASIGVDTSQFPVFLLYNLVMSVGQPTNLNKCCVLGFHGAAGTPIQTYSPIDPLTGTNVAPVKGGNGFTYHLQELAFFSWFYGVPSIAVNNWFSDNNTFTTDAGPVCK